MKILLYVLFLGVIQINFSQTMIQIPLENDASHPSFLIENLQSKSSDTFTEFIQGPISINADENNSFYILDQIGNKILPYDEDGIPRKPINLDSYENTAKYIDLAIIKKQQLIVYNEQNQRFSLISLNKTPSETLSPSLPQTLFGSPFIINRFELTANKSTLIIQNEFDGHIYTTPLAELFSQQSIKLRKVKNSNTTGVTTNFHKKLGFLAWTANDPAKHKVQFSHLDSTRQLKDWFSTSTFDQFSGVTPLSLHDNDFVFALFQGTESSLKLNQIRIASISKETVEETSIPFVSNQLPWYTSRRICSNGSKVYVMSYHKKLRSLNIDIISINQKTK
ncbi:MAG: hypothetical protein KC646_13910 [Candidatus Cloacimonetes bacterium]|nr:hypothetical protein [Candidatus Cloacimonadota bacterium]